jgi:hypothetical protein
MASRSCIIGYRTACFVDNLFIRVAELREILIVSCPQTPVAAHKARRSAFILAIR